MIKFILLIYFNLLFINSFIFSNELKPSLFYHVQDVIGLWNPEKIIIIENKSPYLKQIKEHTNPTININSTSRIFTNKFIIPIEYMFNENKKYYDDSIYMITINNNKMRIQISYGLENMMPNKKTKQILDDVFKPYFKYYDYFNEINIHREINNILTEFYAMKTFYFIFIKSMYNYPLEKAATIAILIIIISVPFIVIFGFSVVFTETFKSKLLYILYAILLLALFIMFFFIFKEEGDSIIMSLFMSVAVIAAFLLISYYFVIQPIKIILYFIKKITNFFQSKTKNKNKENDSTDPYSSSNVSNFTNTESIFSGMGGLFGGGGATTSFSDSSEDSDSDGDGGDDGGSDGGDGGGD